MTKPALHLSQRTHTTTATAPWHVFGEGRPRRRSGPLRWPVVPLQCLRPRCNPEDDHGVGASFCSLDSSARRANSSRGWWIHKSASSAPCARIRLCTPARGLRSLNHDQVTSKHERRRNIPVLEMVGTRLFENRPKVWNLGGLAPAPNAKNKGEQVSKNSVPPLLGRFTKCRRKNSNNAGDDATELTEGLGWSSHNNATDPVIGDPNFDQLHFRLERQRQYSNEKCTTTRSERKRRTRARKEEKRGSLAPADPFDLSGSTSSTSVVSKTPGPHGGGNKAAPAPVEEGTFMGWGEQSDHNSVLGWSSESDDCSDDDTEGGLDTCGWGVEDDSEGGDLLVGFGGTTPTKETAMRRSTESSQSDDLLVGFGSRSDSPNPHESRRQTAKTEPNNHNHVAEDEKSSSSRKRRRARRRRSGESVLSHTDKADILSELEHTMGSNLFASTHDVISGSRLAPDDNPLIESFRRTSGDSGDLATSLLEDFNRDFVDKDDDDNEKPHESQPLSGPISPMPQSRPQHHMLGDDNPRHDQLMSQTTEELRLELQNLQHQSRVNLEALWGDAEQYRVKISGLNDRMLHLKGDIFEAKMARESHIPSDSMHSGPVQTKLSDGPGRCPLRRRTIDLSDSDKGADFDILTKSLGGRPSSRGAFSLNDRDHATGTKNATWDDFGLDAHESKSPFEVDFGGKDDLLLGLQKRNTALLLEHGLTNDDAIDSMSQNDVMISTIIIPSSPKGSCCDDENDEECDRSVISGFGSTSAGPRHLSNETIGLEDYDFDPLMSMELQNFTQEQLEEVKPKRGYKPKRRPSMMKRSRSFSMRPGNLSRSLSRHNSFMNLNLFDASDDDDDSSLSSSPNLDDLFGTSAETLQARIDQKENEIDRVESEIRCQKTDLRQVESDLAQQLSETTEDDSNFKNMEATVRRQVEQVELQEMDTITKLSFVETAREEWREKEENLTDIITATKDALEEQHLILDLERQYSIMHRHVSASKSKSDMDAYDLLVELRSLEIPSIRSGCEQVEDVSCEVLTQINDLRTAQDDLVTFLTDFDRLPFFTSLVGSVNDNCQDLLRKHDVTENLGRDLRCHLTKLTNLIENDVEMSEVCTTTTDSSTSSERLSLEVAFIEALLPLVEAGGRRGRMLLDALAMSDRLLTSWDSVLSPENLDVRFFFSESLARMSSSLQDAWNEAKVELSSCRSEISHELDGFHSKLEDIGGSSDLAAINVDKFASKRKAGSSGRSAPDCPEASTIFHEATKDIFQLTGQENEQGPDSIKLMLSSRQALLDSYAKFLKLLKNQSRQASEENLKQISGLELRLKEVCTKLSRSADSP